MIEPFWWIRSAGVAAVPVSNREPQVSRRDRPTRAAFFYAPCSRTRRAFRDFFIGQHALFTIHKLYFI